MIRDEDRRIVRTRATNRCEYCALHELDSPLVSHQIEHVIPIKHHGGDDLDNLALSCIACNLYKGSNISGFDPDSGDLTRLFHPRLDDWAEHFVMEGLEVKGLTPVGRTTIDVLRLNDSVHLRLRAAATH